MSDAQKSSDLDRDTGLESSDHFEALVRDLTKPLSEQAFRILGDRSHVEEVVQEALLQVWLRRDSFDSSRGSLLGWSMAIVRHLAVDRVRSEQAAVRRDILFAARCGSTPYDEVVDAVERADDYERIRMLLRDLTDLQRQAIQMVYFDNLSVSQVAQLIQIPVPTLRSRLRDAREALGALFSTQ